METCPGSLQLHQFHPVPVPVVPPSHPQLRWPYQPYHSQDQGRDLSNGDQRWLGFCEKKRPDFRPKMSQVTVTTGSTSLFRGPQKKKNHGPGAMSDLVISTMVKHRMILRILRWWSQCSSFTMLHRYESLLAHVQVTQILWSLSRYSPPQARTTWEVPLENSITLCWVTVEKTKASKTGCQKTIGTRWTTLNSWMRPQIGLFGLDFRGMKKAQPPLFNHCWSHRPCPAGCQDQRWLILKRIQKIETLLNWKPPEIHLSRVETVVKGYKFKTRAGTSLGDFFNPASLLAQRSCPPGADAEGPTAIDLDMPVQYIYVHIESWNHISFLKWM